MYTCNIVFKMLSGKYVLCQLKLRCVCLVPETCPRNSGELAKTSFPVVFSNVIACMQSISSVAEPERLAA